MTIRTLNLASLLTTVMLVASCVMPQPTTIWQKTGADDETRRAETAACRATANRELDRKNASRGDVGRTGQIGGESTWSANMATYEAKKSQTALFERCMLERGYHKARIATQ